jgi:hypothetical protein
MTTKELEAALDKQPAVKVARHEWPKLGEGFVENEVHDTGCGGLLRVGKLGRRLVAVEEATPTHLAVRALHGRREAARFVQSRLDAYDRLWDG